MVLYKKIVQHLSNHISPDKMPWTIRCTSILCTTKTEENNAAYKTSIYHWLQETSQFRVIRCEIMYILELTKYGNRMQNVSLFRLLFCFLSIESFISVRHWI